MTVSKTSVGPGKDVVMWSNNVDGLGERLRSILNAKVLAEHYDVALKVSWDELRSALAGEHAILPAQDFFSTEFYQHHVVDRDDYAERPKLKLDAFLKLISEEKEIPEGSVVPVSQRRIKFQAPSLKSDTFDKASLKSAFEDLTFSQPIEEARAQAHGIALPPRCTALHLRAGDVIYGMYRTMDTFQGKVVSYPVSIEIIERLKADGQSVLVFGQDANLLKHLKEKYGVLLADDLGDRDNFSRAQNAIFDICLMGRCQRIFAGTSGFAELASSLALVDIDRPGSEFSADEAVEIISRHVLATDTSSLISGHQRAFAARAAFVLSKTLYAETDRFRALLDVMDQGDPTNGFYQLIVAAHRYRDGNAQEGEATLERAFRLPSEHIGRLNVCLRVVQASGELLVTPYLPAFDAAARDGLAYAALVCAISYKKLGYQDADLMREIFLSNANPTQKAFRRML